MSSTTLTEAMRAHLAPGHLYTGEAAKNWDFDALAGAGAIRSTANDMLRYLKANMGTDQSPLTAALKFAQQPRDRHGRRNRESGGRELRTTKMPAAFAVGWWGIRYDRPRRERSRARPGTMQGGRWDRA